MTIGPSYHLQGSGFFDNSSTEPNQINLATGEMVAIISKAGGYRGWWKGAVIRGDVLGKLLIQYYQRITLQDSFPKLTTTLLIPYNQISRRVPRSRAGSSPSLSNASSPRPSTRRSIPPIIGKAEVSFDYSSTEPNQINLATGEMVAIISKAGGDRGWWKGAVIRGDGLSKIGYFPLAYVEEIDDDNGL